MLAPRTVEQIQVGLEEQCGVAAVEPVVVGGHREQTPAGDDLGKRGTLDRDPLAGGDALQHRRLQHVGTAVDLVARRCAGGRLLDESFDPAVAVGGDDAERRGVVDSDEVNGRFGRLATVEVDERGDVEIREDVSVGDDERVVDAAEISSEPDRPGGVERLGFDRVAQHDAVALTVGKRLDERLRLEAQRQA